MARLRPAAARSRIRELTEQMDRICRTPIEPDALTERLRRMVELAQAEAGEITTRARAAAEQSWSGARETTDRLRRHHERLVVELEARRDEVEAEHRELMRQAHERIETMTREAEQRRRELDEQSARLRTEVEAGFELAMAARRAEAMREIDEQRTAAPYRLTLSLVSRGCPWGRPASRGCPSRQARSPAP